MDIIVSILARIVNILFPTHCVGCGISGAHICEKCLAKAPRARDAEYSFISSLFEYQNTTIRQAIWNFKYKNARGVAQIFGEKLYEEIIADLGDRLHISKSETFLLVPIPLHKKRSRERGYNQSELLAQEIIKYDTENIFVLTTNALSRTRPTNAQARKEKRQARFENLKGAFTASNEVVRGKNIILIDDVTTTGATLTEARNTLLATGAREVIAWTVAH